jgi:hypothetical protein
MRESEQWQHKLIHVLCGKLGMTNDHKEALRGELKVESFSDLPYHEARKLIKGLEERAVAAGVWKPKPKKGKRGKTISPDDWAAEGTIATLQFYVLACGIHYVEFVPYTADGGVLMQPEEVRAYVRRNFDLGRLEDELKVKNKIPATILKHMYGSWINAKCNQFLVEKGFRSNIARPHICFFWQLKHGEAQYLINRFREILANIEKQDAPIMYPILNQSGGAPCPSVN